VEGVSEGEKITMRVLIGCECSGIVREAFRARGHEAWSCDLQPADDGSRYHYQCDLFQIIYENWDLFIGHPPCTFLLVAGARWKTDPRYPNRMADMQKAIDFFMKCWNAQVNKICLENPVGEMSTIFRKPDQIIQPYEFGHNATKKTCLWLKNLPLLEKKYYEVTNEVDPHFIHNARPGAGRSKLRSQTFRSIALAMADQWG
jgi:hypothetical protein